MTSFTTFRRLFRINAATSLIILGLWFALGVNNVRAQAITEAFDNITTLPAAGWFTQNNSAPVGTTSWFQGNPAVFPAQAGATNSYIGGNFNATTGTNTISLWLLTPNRTFNNGDTIKFWTRNPTDNPFPDRLEVRLSTNGASTNVGATSTSVGDFTTVLTTINPGLAVGGYPEVWTEFTLTLSGLPAGGVSGRVAFRYFVTGGGPTGDNSNYIGIDTFSYTPAAAMATADAALDYDGDHRTDYTVVRNVGGGSGGQVNWYIQPSSGGATRVYAWGISTDFFVSGDFDGDGKDDVTVYRPSTPGNSLFYILNSTGFTLTTINLGQTGDDPTIVNDYNGDGKDDAAVYRGGASAGQQSYWFYKTSAGDVVHYVPWGSNGDFPNPGDFDGDGKADYQIQRNSGTGQGYFMTLLATGAQQAPFIFGTSSDLLLPGDYDGDGKTDVCVARGSGGQIIWTYRRSIDGVSGPWTPWGLSASDFPTQGDYDGDGRTDMAVWRPNADPTQTGFWVRNVATGAASFVHLGQQGDYPVANYNSH
ncbi:MAG TPA: choice-of-anchor J domain-containing protein [Pyrinomonadaceae bacterium]|nr:choice-of-anchor J domain-containing protein [Pyrinomonadaceae bacterium]